MNRLRIGSFTGLASGSVRGFRSEGEHMGLDITAYRQVSWTGVIPDDGDYDYQTYAALYPNEHFVSRADDMKRGLYTFANEFHFRAGSYGGYGDWRRWLAQTIHGCDVREFWRDGPRHGSDAAFAELLNFSDCEGVIGPRTSAKLAADFAAHQHVIDAQPQDWRTEKYAEWRKAFELATDNGAVDFH
jgi:hypothetical protein